MHPNKYKDNYKEYPNSGIRAHGRFFGFQWFFVRLRAKAVKIVWSKRIGNGRMVRSLWHYHILCLHMRDMFCALPIYGKQVRV